MDYGTQRKKGSVTWIWLKDQRKQRKIECFDDQEIRELPLSLIESEILTRLPAKSVGRCRCVCKQWKSFLSTPSFVRMHLNRVTVNDYKLLLVEFSKQVATVRTLDNCSSTIRYGLGYLTPQRALASLDGLVCLASLVDNGTYNLLFWNPLTRAYKLLSPRPEDYLPPLICDVFSLFIDSYNDYKLLDLVVRGCFRAFIYSHRLDSWREIVSPVLSDHMEGISSCSEASLWGDCLYFTLTNKINNNNNDSWIICFDVKTESFKKISFPPVPGYTCVGSLVVLNGCLYLCVSYMDYLWKQGGLWIMNRDGFVKVSTFNYFQLDILGLPPTYTTTADNWLVVFDPKNDCLKKLNKDDFTKLYWYFCFWSWKHKNKEIIYVETLVSPKLC